MIDKLTTFVKQVVITAWEISNVFSYTILRTGGWNFHIRLSEILSEGALAILATVLLSLTGSLGGSST